MSSNLLSRVVKSTMKMKTLIRRRSMTLSVNMSTHLVTEHRFTHQSQFIVQNRFIAQNQCTVLNQSIMHLNQSIMLLNQFILVNLYINIILSQNHIIMTQTHTHTTLIMTHTQTIMTHTQTIMIHTTIMTQNQKDATDLALPMNPCVMHLSPMVMFQPETSGIKLAPTTSGTLPGTKRTTKIESRPRQS